MRQVARPERFELPTFWFVAEGGQSYMNLPEPTRMKQNQQIAANPGKPFALPLFTFSSPFAAIAATWMTFL
jgi:hypothetical protein